uniref:DnaJ homolog subfamily C member 4-like n=1 Tax=Phallusia mammillata TaxID=59560 RepID=A0A6F9DAM4_9ASCI|nr:dnaJ homolog subfamily C member 4-like [Phallusia mammillata]
MDLESAKAAFIELSRKIHPGALPGFINWIKDSDEFQVKDEGEVILDNIAEDLRQIVPFEAILPSETLFTPVSGVNADCDEVVTLHVDSFLFDDDYIDHLVENNKFSRNYCLDCQSRKTKPLTFISHSASKPVINLIFKHCLPNLYSKTLIDVGSRLGPILFAGYLYSSAAKIIGIEINKEFCHIQEQVAQKYGMMDRISIINDDVLNCSALLSTGDVIILHNVFEFFTEASKLEQMWTFVSQTLRRSGQLILTCPSLEESLSSIGMDHILPAWVEEVKLDFSAMVGETDEFLEDIHLYTVK